MELRQGAFIAFFEKARLKGGTRVPMTDINLRQLEWVPKKDHIYFMSQKQIYHLLSSFLGMYSKLVHLF